MIALFLLPIYIVVNIYILKWIIKWIENYSKYLKNIIIKYIITFIYTFFASSFIIGYFLPIRWIKVLGNYWLGVIHYIVIVIVITDLIRRLLIKKKYYKTPSKKVFLLVGLICFVIISSITTYGVIHAKKIIYNNNYITLDKKESNIDTLKISLVADLHLGYNSNTNHISKMVDMINQSNPDIVIIAGDIFDNDYDAILEPDKIIKLLKNINSKYGVYAVYGNHDIDESLLAGFSFSWDNTKGTSDKRMNQLLIDSNITLIQDNCLVIDNNFNLCGRLDYHKLGMDIERRKTPEELISDINNNLPIIVIDHEPNELVELSLAEVDLTLSGHTHNGQIFPYNIIAPLINKNAHGIKKINNMVSAVTSGIGVYGPNMRIGTTAEVMNLDISFE